ncbi:MAG: hypothetical protein JWM27_2216 [Gemmatimonadetes bacterium]|nr:hypothetical protein [Gemmatimonadota bacterium]
MTHDPMKRRTPRRTAHARAAAVLLALGLAALSAACDGSPSEPALPPAAPSADAAAGTGPVIILSGLVTQSLAKITVDHGAAAAAVWSGKIDVLKQAIRDAMTASNTPLADQKRAELKVVQLGCVLDGLGTGIVAVETQNVQTVIAGVKAALQKGGATAADAARANAMVASAAALLPGVAPKAQAADWAGALDLATQAGSMVDGARALVGVADPASVPAGPVPVGTAQFPIEQPAPWAYQPTYPSQSACAGLGAAYDVGPGQPLAKLSAVPWTSLKPCDNVRIHWSATPYREIVQIGSRGAANRWIRVTGVPGPNGELPVLDGSGAVAPANLSFSNSIFEGLGMILVLPTTAAPYGYKPGYLEISNLEVRGASMRTQFTNRAGVTVPWHRFASGIYIERAEHVAIRNCHLHDNGNGLFQNSKYGEAAQSRDLLVEGSSLHDNGNPGSAAEHNAYTEGVGTVYQYNFIGALMPGGLGEGIKDRSVGITIRYNHMEATQQLIMLVDPESNHDYEVVQRDAWGGLLLDAAYVYGNELVMKNPASGPLPWEISALVVGDPTNLAGRSGKVYFYNNTVVSRQDKGWWAISNTPVFALFRPGVQIQARNNVLLALAATPGGVPRPMSMFTFYGDGDIASNWISKGWFPSDPNPHTVGTSVLYFGTPWNGSGMGTVFSNVQNAPGFVNQAAGDYHLAAGSALVGAGAPLDPEIAKTGNLPAQEYVAQGQWKPRSSMTDLGAYAH